MKDNNIAVLNTQGRYDGNTIPVKYLQEGDCFEHLTI
jgi:hypothetical protein